MSKFPSFFPFFLPSLKSVSQSVSPPSFLCSCIPWFLHSFIPASFIPAFLRSCIPSLLHFIPALSHPVTRSITDSLSQSVSQTFIHSLVHSLCIYSCIRSLEILTSRCRHTTVVCDLQHRRCEKSSGAHVPCKICCVCIPSL